MSQGCTNQIQRSRNPKQLTYCITMSYLKLSRLLFSNPSVTKTYVYIDKVTRVHIFAFSTVSVYHYYLTSVGPNSSKELCNIIVRHNLWICTFIQCTFLGTILWTAAAFVNHHKCCAFYELSHSIQHTTVPVFRLVLRILPPFFIYPCLGSRFASDIFPQVLLP